MDCSEVTNINEQDKVNITTQLSFRTMFDMYSQQHPNNAKVMITIPTILTINIFFNISLPPKYLFVIIILQVG